jgi:hypothetical protein
VRPTPQQIKEARERIAAYLDHNGRLTQADMATLLAATEPPTDDELLPIMAHHANAAMRYKDEASDGVYARDAIDVDGGRNGPWYECVRAIHSFARALLGTPEGK